MRSERTVCIADTGEQLAVYAGSTQTLVGSEFYVGQQQWIVKEILREKGSDDVIVVLSKPASEEAK